MRLRHPYDRPKIRWRTFSLLAAGLGVVLFGIYRFSVRAALNRELESLADRGLPVSGRDLNAFYSRPVQANAASVVMAAVNAYHRPPRRDEAAIQQFRPQPGERIAPDNKSLLTEHVRTNAHVIAMLADISKSDQARYPVDFAPGLFTPMQHLIEVKNLVWLLRWKMLLDSVAGQTAAALQDFETGLRVAATLRHEPAAVSQDSRRGSVWILLDGLEDLLARISLSDAELVTLTALLDLAAKQSEEALPTTLTGERAMHIPVFQLPSRTWDDLTRDPKVPYGPHALDPRPATITRKAVDRNLFHLRTLSGERDRDLTFFLRSARQFEELLAKPWPEKRVATDALEQSIRRTVEFHPKRLLVSQFFYLAVTQLVRREVYWLARVRCAQAAIAVERYRLRHRSALPSDLGQLVPEFLPEAARDPYDGSPLILAREGPSSYSVQAPATTDGKEGATYRRYKEVVNPIQFRVLNSEEQRIEPEPQTP